MNNKVGWTLGLVSLLLSGVAYYFITLSLYIPEEDLFDFPVPKNADLVGESIYGKNYDWWRATEESGIPFGYELTLKANGWKKEEGEGASNFYTKGNHKIDLISTTKHIDIIKVY